MKDDRFHRWMTAVEDDLLEEAAAPQVRRRSHWVGWVAAAAACACLAAALSLQAIRPPAGEEKMSTKPTGMQDSAVTLDPAGDPGDGALTLADLAALGYDMTLPEEATGISCTFLSQTESGEPIAQATFCLDGADYTYRAQKAEQPVDISGLGAGQEQPLSWKAGDLELQLCSAEAGNWVSWYEPETQTQRCLSGEEETPVLTAAREILLQLGLDMAVAPEGARNVSYRVFSLDGLTVAETTFTLDGVNYAFRTASTMEVSEDFADISGDGAAYDSQAETQVEGRPARLSYTQDCGGKAVWFDVVPGLLYSLTMDRQASQEALVEMAELLFVPAQGEVP